MQDVSYRNLLHCMHRNFNAITHLLHVASSRLIRIYQAASNVAQEYFSLTYTELVTGPIIWIILDLIETTCCNGTSYRKDSSTEKTGKLLLYT